MVKKIFILTFSFIIIGSLFIYNYKFIKELIYKNDTVSEIPEKYYLKDYKGKINIKINPMTELDFKTKSEIYNIRKKYVFQHPELVKKNYSPSDEIFGQIIDKKPWWGINGLYYYGAGEKSIDGPSEETRFIVNPYLLIGLCEVYSYPLNRLSDYPEPFYPKPLSIVWDGKKNCVNIKYDVKVFLNGCIKYEIQEQELGFIAYNAKDFGLNYLYLLPESKNVLSMDKGIKPVYINQFIHCGGSCGYPGGGNNMSPANKKLNISIINLPARANINLWKNAPENVFKEKPDMKVIIDII